MQQNFISFQNLDAKKLLQHFHSIVENNLWQNYDDQYFYDFLEYSSKPDFLMALDYEQQTRLWAEIVFKIIEKTNFNLLKLFEQRKNENPSKILFKDYGAEVPTLWTYEQVYRLSREFAALFLKMTNNNPSVAIFSQNSVFSAITDLSCLMYDIFVSPLNVHFNEKNLIEIFNHLQTNIVITDTKDRVELLKGIRNKVDVKFEILTTQQFENDSDVKFLLKEAKKLDVNQINQILEKRKKKEVDEVATIMFTSGSTGTPKGVSFSMYNIISKRFARGAALPFLGKDEVLLCYLPLYHTFGRYLELIGSIYWRGTYVFVGNNSKETLIKLFPIVQPTIFISIPLRWQNLYETIVSQTETLKNQNLIGEKVAELMGKNFKWGLSAAGYLDPKVFKFFQSHKINLCSGFGMTEATGGITMTPPFEYKENSVGKPLPGIFTKLNEKNELEIAGHYVARYSDKYPKGTKIPIIYDPEKAFYIKTGDIFKVDEDGFYYIIDRVKDIYKNNRGQTIAPRVIEQKFVDVPGIKQVFLIGDGRPYNVLLIVPDFNSTVLKETKNIDEYFHNIIMAANKDVAPYERVVNYAILDRPFSVEKGEITHKGSYNRKIIEKNFKTIIDKLYVSNIISLKTDDFEVLIPRWFIRDLGILETDIKLSKRGLVNVRSGKQIFIKKLTEKFFVIGDLIYQIENSKIDLGLFARQPKLWLGNAQLIDFSPVKEGWDVQLKNVSEHVRITEKFQIFYSEEQIPDFKAIKTTFLKKFNKTIILALYGDEQTSLEATEKLADYLERYNKEVREVARLRLEALAYSQFEKVRALAYRILLLSEPSPDYQKSFPVFLKSGKTYLTEESIEIIASSNIGKQQLQALRQRLFAYRTKLKWDLDPSRKKIFENVFKLLYKFTIKHFEFFPTIRSELSSWILHKESPELSQAAYLYLKKITDEFDKFVEKKFRNRDKNIWNKILVFGVDVPIEERERIIKIFSETFFLEKSLLLTFNDFTFSTEKIVKQGLWITKLLTLSDYLHYRISINTIDGKHYDLHMVLSKKEDDEVNVETQYWMSVISLYPYGNRVVPTLGCSDLKYKVLITEYVGGLTVWDKAREYTSIHKSVRYAITEYQWKKLYVKAFSAFFRAWKYSGFKIVPGVISPSNVSVPELDFKQNTMIISLTGWKPYKNVLSLISPILREFYFKVIALYPWTKSLLKTEWIFDAIVETFGYKKGLSILEKFIKELNDTDLTDHNNKLLDQIANDYFKNLKQNFYYPIALFNAIEQYEDWQRMNPIANSWAKVQTIQELIDLYQLNQYPEIIRYKLFAETYFKDANSEIREKFEKLLEKMAKNPDVSPLQFIELSELQESIGSGESLNVFNKMVFPKIKHKQQIHLQKSFSKDELMITSHLSDKYGNKYLFRPPINPSEVGQLYQLFYKENYPKEISDADKLIVLLDKNERVIGGLAYRNIDNNIVLLDGMVVISTLQGRGLGSAMIEDFFTRMTGQGVKIIKAHFLFGNYYLKHNFKVDKNWGALIKIL